MNKQRLSVVSSVSDTKNQEEAIKKHLCLILLIIAYIKHIIFKL